MEHETVLIMQGGGSLGAYECGVYKTLHKRDIELDIIAGTSIGAVNAAIIAGSKTNNPASDLEQFWLTLADKITPSFLPDTIRSIYADVSNIGDWYDWLFSSNASSLKKGIGIATLILIGVLIGKASYDAVLNSDIKQSMFGIIAIAIVFLVLPLISKLKIGPVELEMKSKGQQPSFG